MRRSLSCCDSHLFNIHFVFNTCKLSPFIEVQFAFVQASSLLCSTHIQPHRRTKNEFRDCSQSSKKKWNKYTQIREGLLTKYWNTAISVKNAGKQTESTEPRVPESQRCRSCPACLSIWNPSFPSVLSSHWRLYLNFPRHNLSLKVRGQSVPG